MARLLSAPGPASRCTLSSYFECNYAGANAMVLDRFFGSLHNGTPAAHARMRARAHARMRTRKATA